MNIRKCFELLILKIGSKQSHTTQNEGNMKHIHVSLEGHH